ncbi:MAG: hypothetical protein M1833_004570 [Piccolia ochrophora]|nr:MAG: hypothetical protein M1833_004570 [Piccolia ochrophora]
MQYTLATLAFALGVSASVLKRQDAANCFEIEVSGSTPARVGQLDDGQLRVGNFPAKTFRADGNKITDDQNRGCVLTGDPGQFQCDQGAAPAEIFSGQPEGDLKHDNDGAFFVCEADQSSFIVTTKATQAKCYPVTLKAVKSDCRTESSSSSSSTSTTSTTVVSTGPLPDECPVDLNGDYEFPHLIGPIDKDIPDKQTGTTLYGQVTPGISTIFNFDVPTKYAGRRCTLNFFLPTNEAVGNTANTLSGSGKVEFSQLNQVASQQTTYNSAPAEKEVFVVEQVGFGFAKNIKSIDCPAGNTVSFKLESVEGTDLFYRQDYAQPPTGPVGLFLRVC